MVTRVMLLAAGLVMVSMAVAQAQPSVQTSLDGRTTLIQSDVGDERWAITHDPGAATATGNVFFPGGGDAAFIYCDILGQSGDNFNLSCFGSDACPGAPCTPAQWNPLGPVTLPGSFFSPPGGSPLTTNPCPSDMERAGAQCIDRDIRAAQDFRNATVTCHNLGRSLCPIEVLIACDNLELSPGAGAPVSCGEATDGTAARIMWTGAQSTPFNADIYANLACYRGNNELFKCSGAELHEFFCCQAARQ